MSEEKNSIPKSLSESRFSEASQSVNSVASIGENGFHASKLLKEFRECMEKSNNDEVAQNNCAYIARRSTDNNPKTYNANSWTQKHLEDAGHGRYNGK